MKKIKIIDLLNKLANGEEMPQEIIYNDIFRYFNETDQDYCIDGQKNEKIGELYLFYGVLTSATGKLFKERLNDEVEIVEKKPVTVEEVEKDLKYVLDRTLKAFERNDCIEWNFTDIREKYGFDDTEEEQKQ